MGNRKTTREIAQAQAEADQLHVALELLSDRADQNGMTDEEEEVASIRVRRLIQNEGHDPSEAVEEALGKDRHVSTTDT